MPFHCAVQKKRKESRFRRLPGDEERKEGSRWLWDMPISTMGKIEIRMKVKHQGSEKSIERASCLSNHYCIQEADPEVYMLICQNIPVSEDDAKPLLS
jgi:hypothetical protein